MFALQSHTLPNWCKYIEMTYKKNLFMCIFLYLLIYSSQFKYIRQLKNNYESQIGRNRF